MAETKEAAAMIVAGQMAVQIESKRLLDVRVTRDDKEIVQMRERMLQQYKLCYDAIMALHTPDQPTGTVRVEPRITNTRRSSRD